jgi:23S rRNA C2498 (ribose-2'-O)-methylase RlmM
MNAALQPFLTVALPIMITLVLAMWTNNGRLAELSARLTGIRSDMHRRFDETTTRLDRIERKLDSHEERIVRLEERTSPIHR